MRCELNHDTLARWYDGELDPHHARVVSEHVNGCASCSREIGEWRRVDELLTVEVPPGNLNEQVAQAIRRDQPPLGLWWLKMAAAIVAAAGLGAVGAQMAFPTHEQTTVAVQLDSSLSILEAHFAPGSLAGIDELAGVTTRESTGELP